MDAGGRGADFSDDGEFGSGASVAIHEAAQHACAAGIADGRRDPAHAFVYRWSGAGFGAIRVAGADLSGRAAENRHTLILNEVLLTINCQNGPMSCLAPSGIPDRHAVSRTWNGVEVRYIERHPGPGESWTDVASKNTTVIIRLDQRGGVCEPRLKIDTPTTSGRRDIGFFNWIPENQTIWCYADNVRCVRDLQLRFDWFALETVLGSDCKRLDLREPLLMVYDMRVTRCARVLSEALADGFHDGALYEESLTTALLVALHRAADGRPRVLPSEGLAPWELRTAKEYLEEHSACGVSLAGLAELVGLSPSRLARGFKASTGLAPYTWAMQTRMSKAKTLLADLQIPLSAIALELGFADQSHFTKAFRRVSGITPGEWRHNNRRGA